jgi:hypothetical protein
MKKSNVIGAISVTLFLAVLVVYSFIYTPKGTIKEYISTLEKVKPVSVAIIDTGLNLEKVNSDRVLNPYNVLDDSTNVEDINGHGSIIAELICNNTNDLVSIVPIKVVGEEENTSIENVCKGLRYAIDQGVDIINLSMNTNVYSSNVGDLETLVKEAEEKGIKVVVSAGNTSSDVKYLYPANFKSAYVVGAAVSSNEAYKYSNYGKTVDYSCFGTYNNTIGTSFSCAYVSSIIADLESAETKNVELVLNKFSNAMSKSDYGKYLDIADMQHGEDNGKENSQYLGGVVKSDYNLKSNIFDLDWENMENDELNHYLLDTDIEYVGALLNSLSPEELEKIKSKVEILNTEAWHGDYSYSDKDNLYVLSSETTTSYVDYCISEFKKRDNQMFISEWYSQTSNGVFYMSSPDRNKIYKYVVSGMYGKYSIAGAGPNCGTGMGITVSTYRDNGLSYSGEFTHPIPVSLYANIPTIRARYQDYYLQDGTFVRSETNYDYDKHFGGDAGYYIGYHINFNNYINRRVGYHSEDNGVTALNANGGGGTSNENAYVADYLGRVWEERSSVNFNKLVFGYADVWYNTSVKYSNDKSTYKYKRIPDLYFPINESTLNSNSGTFTLQVSPMHSFGTYWYEELNGSLCVWSDIPEFVFGLTPNTYTINYNGNGATGGSVASQTVDFGNNWTLRDGFTKTGYHLKGYAVVRASDNAIFCGSKGWQSEYGWAHPEKWTIYSAGSTWTMDEAWANTSSDVLNDTFTFCAQWEPNTYLQKVYVRYQNADGSWGSYSPVINKNYDYGSTVSWSRAADSAYKVASISYTVTSANTKYVSVYRNSYKQTINYYYNKASGLYNSPTHTKTSLGSKTWSQLYGTTFNALGYKAAWGNVTGYHWSSIDKNSWTVTGNASTNSFYYPNKYRLYVDVAGGTGTNGNYDMEYGTSINLGTPSRIGWTFKGWQIITNNSTNSSLSSNTFTMGYNNSYKYQSYVAVPTVKIIANWQDSSAPAGNDTILKATNPTKTTTYASVTASTSKADTPWVNNNVLLTFTSKDNESGLSGLGIYEKITSGWKAVSSKTLSGATTAQSITYTDSKEGSYTYYGKATDNASATYGSPANKITSTAELTVHIDKTAPVYKEELLTTGIKHGSLPHGMTTGGVVVDTETGDVNISELSSKITVEVSDENSTLADSTDTSGIKKVTLVVYDSDYVTDSDVYTNIYKAGTGKDALVSALKYKEYDMTAEVDSIEKNSAGAIYEAVYAVTTNLYEDFKTSASLKYFIVAVDNAGNENKVYSAEDEAISNISIFAYITRDAKDLDDGSDNFLCGDGGTLHIVTYGYVDELDIDFPSKLLKASLLDAERAQGEHPLGTTQKDNTEYVEGAILDPTITLTGDCQRNYDYPFVVPLYLGDESIGFLTKASTWTAENPVCDLTELLTFETGYKHTNTMSGTATATAQAKAKCYVGTNDNGETKLTDKFHTHIIAPD